MRVALKDIKGVEKVEVSLERGEAVATLAPGNTVRYDQLLRAIEKNGFVVKGAKIVADGHVSSTTTSPAFEVSGSNDRFRLEPASKLSLPQAENKVVEITGSLPEVPKGKTPDVLRCDSVVLK